MSAINELLQRNHDLEDLVVECKNLLLKVQEDCDESANALVDLPSYRKLMNRMTKHAMNARKMVRKIDEVPDL